MTLVAESRSELEPGQGTQIGSEYVVGWHEPWDLSYRSEVDGAIVPTRLAVEIVALGILPDAHKTGSCRGEAALASLAACREIGQILTIRTVGDNEDPLVGYDADPLVGYVLLGRDRFRDGEFRVIKYLCELAVFDNEDLAKLLTSLGIAHPNQVPSEEDFA